MSHWLKNRKFFSAMLMIAIFCMALWALHHLLKEISLPELEAELRNTNHFTLMLATPASLMSYALLSWIDIAAIKHLRKPLPWWQICQTAWIANAFSHTLGFATVTGGSVRLSSYGAYGLDSAEVAQVIGFNALGFSLGSAFWIGASLVFEPARVSLGLPLSIHGLFLAGICTLVLLLIAIVAPGTQAKQFRIFHRTIALPTTSTMLLLLVVSAVELAFAAASLYLLLPDTPGINFLGFIGLYLIAILAGLVSHVPGGVGVFEATLILLLPGLQVKNVLGAMVIYRIIYYVFPLLLAFLLLGWRAFFLHLRTLLKSPV
jgi:phosphatidylglycerol lysyltransferase